MELWETLRFGARALHLKSMSTASPEKIADKQLSRLRRLVAHAKENSPYLAEKYADVNPETCELADLPVSDKSEVMENFDRWLTVDDVKQNEVEAFFDDESNLGKLFKERYVLSHTSGSTGQPLLLVKAPIDFELMFALQAARGHRTSLDLKEMFTRLTEPVRLAAVTLKPGFYPSGSAFQYMPDGVKNFIDVLQLSLNDENLLARLAEFKPTHLTTYASILHELARAVEAGELDFGDHLEQVVNISEKLMAGPRKRYEKLFGAPVLDDYGMGECLFLTSGCMTSQGMHVNSDWAILEVVDDDNQPVPAGERGAKVLLTNLANQIQPFIRYEVGDVVVMASKNCDCDVTLPLIAEIEGRNSEIFYTQVNGNLRPVHPAIVEQAIGQTTEVREYQIVQDGPKFLQISVEPIGSASIDAQQVRQQVLERLADEGVTELEVQVEVVDRLVPSDQGSKFQRVITNFEPEQ
ncbi:AMP-binding protein [Aeoliella sp. ICT_H6.2]|uniref:AMP-binding protein n=1 Tax=Aeoliella straminimaris TaxID=2954799 RepID=A0A9X2FCD6_9BACT|nr:AMP-binding protein [Aeoliella straminimaris]MCO6046442.1 AMP-binding protein [Aeoliella straminimaris]